MEEERALARALRAWGKVYRGAATYGAGCAIWQSCAWRLRLPLQTAIDVATIGNNRERHTPLPVVDFVYNSIITNSNAIKLVGAFELLASARPRVLRKCKDFRIEAVHHIYD